MKGNKYPHRYKEKRESTLREVEFEKYYENAVKLDELRKMRKESATTPASFRIIEVSISGLLALLYYTGLRISEIVGDSPHIYKVKEWDQDFNWTGRYLEKSTAEIHGLRKMDLEIKNKLLKIDAKEIRKHGLRLEPVFIPIDKLGCKDIINAWEKLRN